MRSRGSPGWSSADATERSRRSISHVGLAYDLSKFDESDPDFEIRRLVCAFYADLCDLAPSHQLRWSTAEIEEGPDVQPHYIWWREQMGNWPDGTGPYEQFTFELKTLDELFASAHGVKLLSTIDRPDGFGWILRPSQSEYDAFVHQLDKLLSDNLQHKAFDKIGIDRRDDADELIGTLRRLELALERFGVWRTLVLRYLNPYVEFGGYVRSQPTRCRQMSRM